MTEEIRSRRWVGHVQLALRVCCLTSTICASSVGASGEGAPSASDSIDPALLSRVFRVLPSNAKSVIVIGPGRFQPDPAPRPFAHRNGQPLYAPDAGYRQSVSVEPWAFRTNTHLFEFDPQLREQCQGNEYELSVFAIRALSTEFEIPGGTRFEGCQVIIFKDDALSSVQERFHGATAHLAGYPIVSATEKLLSDAKHGVSRPMGGEGQAAPGQEAYFALPTRRMLVAATSEQVLEDVLGAIRNPANRQRGFPMPDPLPDARFTIWGIRHIGQDEPQGTLERGRRDTLFVGYLKDSSTLSIRHVTADTSSQNKLLAWLKDERLPLVSRQIDNHTRDIQLRDADGRIWMIVLTMMGLEVFV